MEKIMKKIMADWIVFFREHEWWKRNILPLLKIPQAHPKISHCLKEETKSAIEV